MSGTEAVEVAGSMVSEKGEAQTPNEARDDASAANLSPEAKEAIAARLRAVYAEMLNAPLPDRFSKLLAELSQSDGPSSGKSDKKD